MKLRVFNGAIDGPITSHQGVTADIPGDVRVQVCEEADQRKVAATLRRVADWIDAEAAKADGASA